MNAVLLAAALLGQFGSGKQEPNLVVDLDNLVAVNRFVVYENNQLLDILTLKPSEKKSRGVAWLIKVNGGSATAWKGQYTLFGDLVDEDDVLILEMGFSRKYQATNNRGGWEWERDLDYGEKTGDRNARSGVNLEVQLAKRSVPRAEIKTRVLGVFFADEQGNRTKKYDKVGFIDALKGETGERSLRNVDYLNKGDRVDWTMRRGYGPNVREFFGSSFPPNYEPHEI